MLKVYVAHPYGGEEENANKVARAITKIVKDKIGILPISPIHALGYMYNEVEYIQGMHLCLHLLDTCDELWLCLGWEESRGCCMEYTHASAKGIPIKYQNIMGEWKTWRPNATV